MATPTLTDTRVATTLGPYRIHRVLGRGGMGTVYLATHWRLKRKIALKVIEIDSRTPPDMVERFRREGKMAARLAHPGIAQIFEVGEREDCAYIAMEYVRGSSLKKEIPPGGMDAALAAYYVQAVAVALDHAHRMGVLHRDLKPSNVLIDPLGRPRITDFGLARRMDAERTRATLTVDGSVLGTPAYMSPEQAAGAHSKITAASDVYQLGALLYHLVTGVEPFGGDTPVQVLFRVLNETPIPPRRVSAMVPRPLERICQKAMEKDPARRYRSAREMAQDLERFFRGYEVRAAENVVLGRFASAARRHPKWTAVVVVLVALWAAGAIRLVFGPGGDALPVGASEDLVRASRQAVRGSRPATGLELARRAIELGGALEASRAAEGEALRAVGVAIEAGLARVAALEDAGAWETAAGTAVGVRALEHLRDLDVSRADRGPGRPAERILGPYGGVVRFVVPVEEGTAVEFLTGSYELLSARADQDSPVPTVRSGRPLLAATTLPEGRIAVAGLDGIVRFRAPGSSQKAAGAYVGIERIDALAGAAGGTLAASGSEGVQILSAAGETRARIAPPSDGRYLGLAWQREELWLFATDARGRLHVFDRDGNVVARLPIHARRVPAVVADPAGRWVATGSWDGEVQARTMGEWDSPPLARLEPGDRVTALAASPSGALLAVATWGPTVHVVRTDTWETAAELEGSRWGTASVGFGADDGWLAAGGVDGSIRLWHLD